jgi:Uncharacterized ACR, COG1678
MKHPRCIGTTYPYRRWLWWAALALFQAISTVAFVTFPFGVQRPAAADHANFASSAPPRPDRRRIIVPDVLGSTTRIERAPSTTIRRWFSSSSNSQSETNEEFQGTAKTPIRYLGKGVDAIVREGAVLLAPSHEFHHFYRQAAIFIYSIGTDIAVQRDDDDDDETVLIRGLIIDHPTAYTVNEVLGDDDRFAGTAFGDANLVHRGGDKGRDGLILLHNVLPSSMMVNTTTSTTTIEITTNDDHDGDEQTPTLQMIGKSNIYQGGWDQVVAACASGKATGDNCKAFFNYCEFTEAELEDLLQSNEDGDAWISVEVDSKILLSQEWQRGDCWRRLRNAVREYTRTIPASNS